MLSLVSQGEYLVVNTAADPSRKASGSILKSKNEKGPWVEVAKMTCSFLAASGDQLFPFFDSNDECYVLGKDNRLRVTGLACKPASQTAVVFQGRLYTGVIMYTPEANRAYMAWLDLQSLEWKSSSHVGLPSAVYSGLAADADTLFAASSTSLMVTKDGLNWSALDLPNPPASLSQIALTGGNRLIAASSQPQSGSSSLFYVPLDQTTTRSTPPAFNGLERRSVEVLEKETIRIQPQIEGTAPFVFQWEIGQSNGAFVLIPGATNAHLTLTGVTKEESGVYRLTASNALGKASVDTTLHVCSRTLGGYVPQPSFYTLDQGHIRKLLVNPDGTFYAVGSFAQLGYRTNRLGGVSESSVARFLPDGTKDTRFYCTSFWLGGMAAAFPEPGGGLLISGGLVTVHLGNGIYSAMGRVDSSGRLDTSFVAPISTISDVLAIHPFDDGSLMVGGRMNLINRGNREFYLIRLNHDGSFRSMFPAEGSGPNGTVQSILRQPDGKWIIGGMITAWSGVRSPRVVRLSQDGLLDTTFSAPTNLFLSASVLVQQKDGRILVGVSTLPPGPQASPVQNLVRLNADGSLDGTFRIETDGVIYSTVVGDDGRIYVAGSFSRAGGVRRMNVARFSVDGRVDEKFEVNNGTGLNSALAFTPEGHLLIAGTLSDPDFPKNRILAVYTSLADRAVLSTRHSGSPGQLEVLLQGTAGQSYRVQQSTDLLNWTDHSLLKLEASQGKFAVDTTQPRLWLRAVAE